MVQNKNNCKQKNLDASDMRVTSGENGGEARATVNERGSRWTASGHLLIIAVCLFPAQNGFLQLLFQLRQALLVIALAVLQHLPSSTRHNRHTGITHTPGRRAGLAATHYRHLVTVHGAQDAG